MYPLTLKQYIDSHLQELRKQLAEADKCHSDDLAAAAHAKMEELEALRKYLSHLYYIVC